jgi:hypothetical protein
MKTENRGENSQFNDGRCGAAGIGVERFIGIRSVTPAHYGGSCVMKLIFHIRLFLGRSIA